MQPDSRQIRERTLSESTGYASRASAISDHKLVDEDSYHVHRRWFIGPIPEKVAILNNEDATRKHDIGEFIKAHALRLFLQEGGKLEDWTENQELSAREEMLRKWRESEWAQLLSRRRNAKSQPAQQKWVGSSFEVGDFLGVNVLAVQSTDALLSGVSSHKGLSAFHLKSTATPSLGMVLQQPSDTQTTRLDTNGSKAASEPVPVDRSPSSSDAFGGNESAHSSTVLIERPMLDRPFSARTDVIRRPSIMKLSSSLAKTDSVAHISAKAKGKQKVHYEDTSPSPVLSAATAAEVLGRTGDEVQDSSAGAMSTDAARTDAGTEWGDVVLRDRMFVRASYADDPGALHSCFDEYQNRMSRGLQYRDWGEFMVAWRKDYIEIYEDYSTPRKERFRQHKQLKFVINLKGNTKLSMYSFVDMTFCLTYTPPQKNPKEHYTYATKADDGSQSSKLRDLFNFSKEGTSIFVFKVKTRSRALDWIWQLWRHIGGELPELIEVHNPTLDSKVKIDIPHIATVEGHKMFTRSNIIRLCMQSLHNVPDWKEVVEQQLSTGARVLELAWRIDTHLDWIWLEDDIYNQERPWAVLCGLALRKAHLEIRLGDHYPRQVANPRKGKVEEEEDGEPLYIAEPPSIEGYVERVKSTQLRQRFYLSTHDGNLLVLTPDKAHPPSPYLSEEVDGPAGDGRPASTLREREVERGASQIRDAVGVADLRNIVLVRRAETTHMAHRHTEQPAKSDDDWATMWTTGVKLEPEDEADEGGEEHLRKASDRSHIRVRRSFELLLAGGEVVRFECYSCKAAVEWIERLRALVVYWRLRHRCDAKEEMEVATAQRSRLTPRRHLHVPDEELPPLPPPDPAAPLPALSNLYNWCVLQGCKSIIRGGKIHMRRGLHGQYKMVQMFLISGTLLTFRIKPENSLYRSMKKKISLTDAYVCSGYFAALVLPRGQYDPENNSTPRRYRDGLEADEQEEDTLFIIWYHPPPTAATQVPALSAKRKMAIFRARSKLERDTWCWALNTEIERMARGQRDREALLRDTGELLDPRKLPREDELGKWMVK